MVKIITIDGPVSSGKGVISRLVAQNLGWHFLESGILYRVLAYNVVQSGVAFTDVANIAAMAAELNLDFLHAADGAEAQILVSGQNITAAVRSEHYGDIASQISGFAAVRAALLDCQRAMARDPGLVADGRDMGTVVFPDAQWKFFLTASQAERARRRYKQLQDNGMSVNLAQILLEITERDARDEARSVSPLRAADDAVIIDSTSLTITEVVTTVINRVKSDVSQQ